MAHAVGVSVEGELGCLGSLETGQAGEEDGVGALGRAHRRGGGVDRRRRLCSSGFRGFIAARRGARSLLTASSSASRGFGGHLRSRWGAKRGFLWPREANGVEKSAIFEHSESKINKCDADVC